jgi:hypothetical protein
MIYNIYIKNIFLSLFLNTMKNIIYTFFISFFFFVSIAWADVPQNRGLDCYIRATDTDFNTKATIRNVYWIQDSRIYLAKFTNSSENLYFLPEINKLRKYSRKYKFRSPKIRWKTNLPRIGRVKTEIYLDSLTIKVDGYSYYGSGQCSWFNNYSYIKNYLITEKEKDDRQLREFLNEIGE